MARAVPEDQVHYLWDERNEPTLSVASGDEIFVQTREVSDGQVTSESTSESLVSLDDGRLYPLVGPVHVEGAEPGDVLKPLPEYPTELRMMVEKARDSLGSNTRFAA